MKCHYSMYLMNLCLKEFEMSSELRYEFEPLLPFVLPKSCSSQNDPSPRYKSSSANASNDAADGSYHPMGCLPCARCDLSTCRPLKCA